MLLNVRLLQGDWGQGFFLWTSFVWKQQAACGKYGRIESVAAAITSSKASKLYVLFLQSFLKKHTVDQVIRQLQRSGR